MRPPHVDRMRAAQLATICLTLLACPIVGILLAQSAQAAFVVVAGVAGVAALGAPTMFWVVAALVSSFTFQGLTTLGALPSLATFLSIFVSWGALLVALLRARGVTKKARPYLRWLVALAVVSVISGVFNHVEVLRPAVFIALLGMPYAILAAILVDPPTPRQRTALMKVAMALIIVQIPVALWQAVTVGTGDPVQGTLIERGGGSGSLGAVAVIGAIWLLARGLTWSRVALASALAVLPFIADAKQVLFVFPVIVLAGALQGVTRDYLIRSSFAVGLLLLLIYVAPVGKVALAYIHHDQQQGQNPKVAVAQFLWDDMRSDPVSLTFGKGPAETVTRSAYMTTDGFLRGNSPLRALGLKPAKIAIEADALTLQTNSYVQRSSFQSAVSSALGVFGDLGLAGILCCGGLLLTLMAALARVRSPEGIAAMAGVAMFAVLGFVYAWWEDPTWSVLIGLLVGLALTGPTRTERTRAGLNQLRGFGGES